MQENDQSRRAGRPSLLSEQAPPGDSNSILSKLDCGTGVAKSGAAGHAGVRVAGIAAAVALAGGALGWVLSSPDTPADAPHLAAAVASKPQASQSATSAAPAAVAPDAGAGAAAVPAPPSAPVPAGTAIATGPSAAATSDANVGVAAILDETPPKAAPGEKTLAASLAAPQPKPAYATGGKDELLALLDKPSRPHEAGKADKAVKKAAAQVAEPAPKARPKSEPVKVAQADKAARKDKAAKERLAKADKAKSKDKDKARAVAAASRAKPAAKPKAKAPLDSDAALLAALLAHSKKTSAAPRAKTSEYQKCATLDTAEAADKCRERLCVSGAKAPAECKPPSVAKASS